MSLGSWFRTQRILRARRKAAKNREAPLREFVYLDEVSVYSLIASRRGPLATEFTDSETASLRGELSSSVSADAVVAKGSLGSKLEQSQGRTSQVVRKSTIQTTFKDLYDTEHDYLALGPANAPNPPDPAFQGDEIPALAMKPEYRKWVTPARDLHRGNLAELRVRLDAESLFKVTTVMSTLVDIIKESGSLIPDLEQETVAQALTLYKVLNRMLDGLIPIRGTALDYLVVDHGDESYVVHESVMRGVRDVPPDRIRPLTVVGVADGSLFWKDYRQVLFSGSDYILLCRISSPGLQSDWQPLKIVELVGSAIPDFAEQMSQFGEGALAAMAKASKNQREDVVSERRKGAIETYAQILADEHDLTLNDEHQRAIEDLATRNTNSSTEIRQVRASFAPVVAYVEDTFGLTIDPTLAARLRSAALLESGLTLDGAVEGAFQLAHDEQIRQDVPTYLNTEIVAIYW